LTVDFKKPEHKTALFFIGYFLIAFILEKVFPSGAHAPGVGILLFLLSIPISVIYSLILYFKYNKTEDKQYLNCIFIVSGIWMLIFLLLYFSR
jgi:hypothetical protein